MHLTTWDEGQSWACLPHAVAGFVGAFALQSQGLTFWSFLPLAVGVAFMACRSGCRWNSEKRVFQTYTGWIWKGRSWVWGKRKHVPPSAPLRLDRTRASMMNRRGVPQGVKIDSWELQWQSADGQWHPLHDFVDRALANEVMQALQDSPKTR